MDNLAPMQYMKNILYMCVFIYIMRRNSNIERTLELLNEMEYLMEKKPHPRTHMYSVCGVRTITRKRRVPPSQAEEEITTSIRGATFRRGVIESVHYCHGDDQIRRVDVSK